MARILQAGSFGQTSAPVIRSTDRVIADLERGDTGRSNFAAFLLGGLVIAGGLMAFLYYDNGQSSRDEMVTGSILTAPAVPSPNVQLPATPRQPATGSIRP